jgi:hypothetical protein
MDVWTEKQIQFMKRGGNERFNDFVLTNGLSAEKVLFTSTTPVSEAMKESATTATSSTESATSSSLPITPNKNNANNNVPSSTDIQNKYDTPQVELYKQVLIAEYEGKSIPTTLPPPRQPRSSQTSNSSNNLTSRPMQGFGSSPQQPTGQNNNYTTLPIKTAVCAVGCIATAVVVWMLVPH